MTRRLAILALPLLMLARPATAGTIQVGSAAALGANDVFDWGTVRVLDGGNAVAQSSPRNVGSSLGRTASISDGVAFTGLVEGTDWFGDFNPDDHVLYTGDPNDPASAARAFSVSFDTAVAGLGLQIESAAFFDFGASLEIFDGATSLGLFTVSGVTTGAEDGTAPFLAALSDSANITSAVFTLTSNTDFGFGVNRLLTADSAAGPPTGPPAAVPEPGTLSLFAIGAAGTIAQRRRRRLR